MSNATAERCLLGLVLVYPELYWKVEQKGLTEEQFTDQNRARIFRFIHQAYAAGGKPDRLLLASKIEASKSETCMAELGEIPSDSPLYHADSYIKDVLDAWKKKRFKALQAEANHRMREEHPDEVAHWLAKELTALESNTIEVKTIDSIAPMVEHGWEEARLGRQVGVPSCFRQLNNIMGCYRRKVVTGIGAATNSGKSIVAKMEALHCGIALQRPVALITPEDPDDMVVSSMVGIAENMDTFSCDMGLRNADVQRGKEGMARLRGHPIYIVDMPMTGDKLEQSMTLLRAKYDVELIIIDHLHYVRQNNIHNPRERYDYLMGIISGATKDLSVSTLMMAQLSREANKSGRPPRLSDFKETGNIENEIRTGGMMWVDPTNGYRVIHVEKCKGYASERRLVYLQERGGNVPGFDEVPHEHWPCDKEVMRPWKTEQGKEAWKG